MRLVRKICTSLLRKESSFVNSPTRSAALSIALILICTFAAAETHPTDYKTIVVFGDSLSDTGNVADLTEVYGVRIPGPIADYTDGRFTDGRDTQPPAQNYFGTWVEQFAASLPSHPQVKASLDGGTNYAYGFATTASGTSPLTFGPSKLFPIQVDNIGQQITDYLSTHPRIDSSTLFILWGGAIDVLDAKSPNDVINAAIRQTLNIQRLINAGATQFLVPNLPPLGLTPRLNTSLTTSAPANAASVLFNAWLATGISVLRDFYFYRRLRIYQLNVFSLFNQIVASPGSFSIDDIAHSSQGQPVDPDLYLFWDDLHPTTRGHNILANTAKSLITKQLASQTR